jgi:hypothetical protein
MFDRTRRAIQKVNNAIDKVDGVVQKGNRALTTTNGEKLRDKATDRVRERVAGNSNRCACNAKIPDDSVTCKKPKCVKAMANEWESMHPEEQKKFVQRGKLQKRSEGWVPPKDFKSWK